MLRLADPEAGDRILPGDAVRTQRALEVLYANGRTLSSQQRRSPPPWRVLEFALDPPDLAQRIRRRTAALYTEGLVEETQRLIDRYGSECPLLETIGYGEARRVLAGDLAEAEAVALTERRTRQYAKRQRTWFRRQHRPHWLGERPAAQGKSGGGEPSAGKGADGSPGRGSDSDVLRQAVLEALQGLG
jgi:tRNA dimethylallyltransferase